MRHVDRTNCVTMCLGLIIPTRVAHLAPFQGKVSFGKPIETQFDLFIRPLSAIRSTLALVYPLNLERSQPMSSKQIAN